MLSRADKLHAERCERSVQRHMDTVAQSWSYDDMRAACTYADEPAVPQFQAEGAALRAWRSLCWAACYQMLNQTIAAGTPRPSVEEVIAALPPVPSRPEVS
ncbi:Putative phage tail fibre protein [Methyloversatilis universalis FAM5]|uniref:Phage tail fibre protein n=2 Tax=Methyloversatilis universalis TaxID=378211 RepID=F5RC32_METUF|nr:Putative phage tail fibre protein [Methyloversatilis universalis FAM5]